MSCAKPFHDRSVAVRWTVLLLLLWKGFVLCAQNSHAVIFTQDTISDALLARMKKGNTWKSSTPPSLRAESQASM